MPIVYKPEQAEAVKKCNVKPPYYHDGSSDYNRAISKYRSNEPKGTIWLCPGCGKYAITVARSGSKVWVPVAWYHFTAQRIIRGLDTPGSVL